eukprot:jgi/Tetstr1/454254/TSEL_041173.t1
MPAVRPCEAARRVEGLRLGEERRMHTGATRRYVTCDAGRPLLVQLPTCYTPGGMLSDFDDGARISMVPLDNCGRAEVALLRELSDRIARQAAATAPDVVLLDAGIDPATGEVRACAPRARDVRVFESEDLEAHDCPVLPGDTVTAIVSPDYFWRSADGRRGGVCIRLVQLLLHTDRGRYRALLAKGATPPPPPPPPPPGRGAGPRACAATPPPPPAKARQGPRAAAANNAFRPSVMQIVTARNALRKTTPPPC